MRPIAAVVIAIALLGAPLKVAGQETEPLPPPTPVLNDHQLFKKYVRSTVGPGGLIGAAAAAGYQQHRNYPEQWGQGASGYGKRWASAYASGVLGNTTKYAVAKALHQDPSFVRCQCTGFSRRMRHAVTSVFTARTQSGRRVFSPATVAGITAEHSIPAILWFPREQRLKEGVGLVGVGISAKMGINILYEFFGRPKDIIKKELLKKE
jgi:hypothetical protein